MPYDTPVTSSEEASWTCSANYGATPTVVVTVNIIAGDSATPEDADAALQDMVNLLNGRPQYSGVHGVKSYDAVSTQNMTPSV